MKPLWRWEEEEEEDDHAANLILCIEFHEDFDNKSLIDLH